MSKNAVNPYGQIPQASPDKWRNAIAELMPEVGKMRLSYARGVNGSFLAHGDEIDCHMQIVAKDDEPRVALLIARGHDWDGEYTAAQMADVLHAQAYTHWAEEKERTPELIELRCKLSLMDTAGNVLHTVTVKLKPKQNFKSPTGYSLETEEDEPKAKRDDKSMDPRQRLSLLRHNERLEGMLERKENQLDELSKKLVESRIQAAAVIEQGSLQVLNRVRLEKQQLEEDRQQIVDDNRGDRLFKLLELGLGMVLAKHGVSMPGEPQTPPADAGGEASDDTPSVSVESRLQTLSREILELVDDATWSKLELVNMDVASDLRAALEQHKEGPDDVAAALSHVLPQTLPHAADFAQVLPDSVVQRVLEINSILSA